MLPFFPLEYGLLTGKYRRGESAPAGSRAALDPSRAQWLETADWDRIEAFEKYAEARDLAPLDVAIAGLAALNRRCQVIMVTDSEYLKNGITSWIVGWQRNGWKTKEKQPVKNADLWQELLALTERHQISWRWTKGHANDAENNRCDELANEAIRKL